MLLCQRGQSLLIPSPSPLLTLTLKLYHTHPRAGRAGAPRPPTFRKTNAPAGPFGADAFGFVTVHDGILKQRAGHAVAHARRRLKSLDRLYRVASLRHRHSLYSTTPTPPMGSDPLGSTCRGTFRRTSPPLKQVTHEGAALSLHQSSVCCSRNRVVFLLHGHNYSTTPTPPIGSDPRARS